MTYEICEENRETISFDDFSFNGWIRYRPKADPNDNDTQCCPQQARFQDPL